MSAGFSGGRVSMRRRGLSALLMFTGLLVASCASMTAVPAGGSTPTVSTPVPVRPPTASPIPLGNHAIYVVDTRNGDLVRRILVSDADAQRIVSTMCARYTPEI